MSEAGAATCPACGFDPAALEAWKSQARRHERRAKAARRLVVLLQRELDHIHRIRGGRYHRDPDRICTPSRETS